MNTDESLLSVRSLALRELLGPRRVESLFFADSNGIWAELVGGVVVDGSACQLGPATLRQFRGRKLDHSMSC